MKFVSSFSAAMLVLAAGPADAAAILPISYEMPSPGNGSFAYQDEQYTGGESGGYLSGGLGDLTDGVIPPAHWNSYGGSNVPWVGWQYFDPTIIFHFAPDTVLNAVTFSFDFNYDGGVAPPSGVTLTANGNAIAPVGVGIVDGPIYRLTYDLNGLGVTDLSTTLNRGSQWIMLGEVSFDGDTTSPTPEPASWAMMLIGFGAIGAAVRHKRGSRSQMQHDAA